MSSTKHRVSRQTTSSANKRSQRASGKRVRHSSRDQDQVERRLRELDREWDIERAFQANAGVAGLLALMIAARSGKRRWLALPVAISGFLLQHAIQGWCPPVSILRRLGLRTSYEIEEERRALKALRGDFARLPASGEQRIRAGVRAARA